MKVYLCGPISFNNNYKKNFAEAKTKIEKAASEYKNMDIKVFSPASLNLDDYDWEYCMKKTLTMMLSCDTVVVLDSIKDSISRQAALEQMIAHEVGINVFTFDDFMLRFSSVPF
jgi:nucleoside 2-deoxyribosyltransferase